MSELTAEEKKHLKRAYNRLVEQLHAAKKWSGGSVLTSMLNIKSNDRMDLLSKTAVSYENMPKNILESLSRNGHIRPAGSTEKFALTAAAVVYVEAEEKLNPLGTLIQEIDDKYFKEMFAKKGQTLTSREKTILFTLLLFRAFSEKAALSLKREEAIQDKIKEAVDHGAAFLKASGVIPRTTSEKDLFGEGGNDRHVVNLVRHSDVLPKKTAMIFRSGRSRDLSYYLNLTKGTEVNAKDLGYVLWLIFRDSLTKELFANMDALSRNTLSEYGIIVFEDIGASFYGPKHNGLLQQGYYEYESNKSIWAGSR